MEKDLSPPPPPHPPPPPSPSPPLKVCPSICRGPGGLIGNGRCDPICNRYECRFDGYDCEGRTARPGAGLFDHLFDQLFVPRAGRLLSALLSSEPSRSLAVYRSEYGEGGTPSRAPTYAQPPVGSSSPYVLTSRPYPVRTVSAAPPARDAEVDYLDHLFDEFVSPLLIGMGISGFVLSVSSLVGGIFSICGAASRGGGALRAASLLSLVGAIGGLLQ